MTKDRGELKVFNGRITGSSSVETLVRVGLEKQNSEWKEKVMVVLHDFVPCVDDELAVKRGERVNILFQENDWAYVIAKNGREGFIPYTYCVPLGASLDDIELSRSGSVRRVKRYADLPLSNYLKIPLLSSTPDVEEKPFLTHPYGFYVAEYDFLARDENDVDVKKGDRLLLLNRDDADWSWVRTDDYREGFVPSNYITPQPPIGDMTRNWIQPMRHSNVRPNTAVTTTPSGSTTTIQQSALPRPPSKPARLTREDGTDGPSWVPKNVRVRGTRLVALFDYEAQAPDDLTIRRGEWLCADTTDQDGEDWIWVYSLAKSGRQGFIPKAFAKPPMTII